MEDDAYWQELQGEMLSKNAFQHKISSVVWIANFFTTCEKWQPHIMIAKLKSYLD